MQDKVTIQKISLLHPKVIPIFTQFINNCEDATGRIWRVVQGLRTIDEQNAIYAQGRTTPGKIVTWAKGGQSFHNYGLAIDAVPFGMAGSILDWNYDFTRVQHLAENLGIECGMSWPAPKKDIDHFQLVFSHSWQQLLQMYNDKNFIEGTEFVNL